MTYDDIRDALGINSNKTATRRLPDAERRKLIEVWSASESRTSARRYKALVSSAELDKRPAGGVFPTPEAVQKAFLSLSGGGRDVKMGGEAGEGGEDPGKSDATAPISTTSTPFTINSEGDAPLGKPETSSLSNGSARTEAALKREGRL